MTAIEKICKDIEKLQKVFSDDVKYIKEKDKKDITEYDRGYKDGLERMIENLIYIRIDAENEREREMKL